MSLKTIVITGATSGIGKETALALARKGYAIYLLVRNIQKGAQLKQEIIQATANNEIYVVECDLSSLKSVTRAADELCAKLESINVLINNAGGIFEHRELSKDGYEMSFAINHLGHFLLTDLLLPLLTKGTARIINLSSEAHKIGKPNFEDLQFEQSYSSFKAYGNAKLYNIYFTMALAERYGIKGITAYAVHPGLVKTAFGTGLSGLGNVLMWLAKPWMISAKKGAKTPIYLATEPKMEPQSGLYFKRNKPANTAAMAQNIDARNDLWEISENLINKTLN